MTETNDTPTPKIEFIISVSGGNISADVLVKSEKDFPTLDGLIDTVKQQVKNNNNG